MVYSFAPLPPVTADHVGFFLICVAIGLITIVAIIDEFETGIRVAILMSPVILIAYLVSYHWTNQEVLYYKNEKVEAKFIGFESEGYNQRSGKTRADYHYTYVIYEVNGNNVILKAQTGVEYPKTAVLYGN